MSKDIAAFLIAVTLTASMYFVVSVGEIIASIILNIIK